MWKIFYNIIIKSANVDKGGGEAYPQNVDRKDIFFKPLPKDVMQLRKV